MSVARVPDRDWFRSSYSGGNGNCVEVAGVRRAVGVRDSKRRDDGSLTLAARSWAGLLGRVR